jgi:hypothetical protein
VEHSDSIAKIAAALVAVQSKLKPIKKNAENPAFKKDGKSIGYLDLAGLCEVALPILTAEGIAVVQGGAGAFMETMLLHSSGEWVRTSLPMPATDNPQKLGSVVTYFRRYGLAAAIGAVSEDEDDDGNAASHPPARSTSAPPPANRPAPQSAARPTAPAAPTVASGGSPATLTVTYLDTATGEKNGKAWTRYSAKFSDGTKASTFDTKHGDLLKRAKAEGLELLVGFETKGNFVNIVDVMLPGDSPSDDEDGVPF